MFVRQFLHSIADQPVDQTAQHLKDSTDVGVDDSLIGILTVFVNLLLAGKIPKFISPILIGDELIALEKKDGENSTDCDWLCLETSVSEMCKSLCLRFGNFHANPDSTWSWNKR